MSWWKNLASIGGIAAAPFTGGASLGITAALSGLGKAASGAAQGAEDERLSGVNYQLLRDKLGLDSHAQNENALVNRGQLDLDRRQQTMASGNNAFQQAMRSALALNHTPTARPAGVQNVSFIGGGIGAQGKAAAEAMNREAMIRLLEGDKFDALPELSPYALNAPTEMPKAGTLEKILGILGLGGQALGAIGGATRQAKQAQGLGGNSSYGDG